MSGIGLRAIYYQMKAYMHLGWFSLVHVHEGPSPQQRDLKERFRRRGVLHVAWLRLLKEMVRHPMPQEPRQLLHRNSGLFREFLKGRAGVKGYEGLDVVTKDGLKSHRDPNLTRVSV